MKLRIKGSSLRLRLTQGEVQQLLEQGAVEEQVLFGPGAALTYRLSREIKIPEITASYIGNLIHIRVPEALAVEWSRTDRVTLAHSQRTGVGELRIAVEKDFACLESREGEDESDNFPHPAGSAGKQRC